MQAITDNKERDWPAMRTAERFRMEYYAQAVKAAGRGAPPDQDKIRISQNWVVGDVDHCVNELSIFIRQNNITDLVTWAVPPGLRPDAVEVSLRRFATEVAPRLKEAAQGAAV